MRHPFPRRGQVWLVSLDPTAGHEVRKTRPAVVVSDDLYNEYNWVVLVVPMTSHPTAEYDQVLVSPGEGGLTVASVTLPDQLRAVDRRRFRRQLGSLPADTMQRVDLSLKSVLGLS